MSNGMYLLLLLLEEVAKLCLVQSLHCMHLLCYAINGLFHMDEHCVRVARYISIEENVEGLKRIH